ncbi:hypothetical protein [uncultured Marivirga sp.]|uniref:hypothetical protein n=1 Tax=uncultured Marivirga sp. TaxID=1123707 RepID=UPI0030EEED2E|tara:strand:- start:87036 stop:87677 length:642 start_codon:yes stop_codon:yes gene_type:complete
MQHLIKALSLVLIIFSTFKLSANEPKKSSFSLIENVTGEWIINLNASITAFQYELEFQERATNYTSIEEFKQVLLKHIKESIHLTINGGIKPILLEGKVMVDKTTTVAFKLGGLPDHIEQVYLKNESFTHINSDKFIFIISKLGLANQEFIVSTATNNQLNIIINENEITPTAIPIKSNLSSISILATAVGLLVFIIAKGQKLTGRKMDSYYY